jgi:tripeptidyl-peptidase-1
MKLGLQGVSVVLSSGDSGVSGNGGCLGTTGKYLKTTYSLTVTNPVLTGKVFSPDFPATCPYITTVGSTFLPANADPAKDAEISTTRFPSGGGFSNIYPIPSYQSAAVAAYLKNSPPPYKSYQTVNATNIGANGGIFNSAGRAYPDVSAIGDNVAIFNAGSSVLIGGTSASAPAWGGIITRINEERIKAGKSTVGFLNPTLVSYSFLLTGFSECKLLMHYAVCKPQRSS